MQELRLSDEILMHLEKPARYIGNEPNMVWKSPEEVDVRLAVCFPDVYEIGMSHLGLSILYNQVNKRTDASCERVFSPWPDLDKVLREKDIPLFALESQQDVRSFDLLGFTVQYEMSYTNILQILDLSKIPLLASERTPEDPVVCAGGPCTYNPEPLADFVDFFYIGEAEVAFDQVLDLYKQNKERGGSREDYLVSLLDVEGIYVPRFYDVAYKEDGTIASFRPNHPKAKSRIQKRLVVDLKGLDFPLDPIVPYIKPVHDRMVLELFRGCSRGCRFCQAGMVYRPVRNKPLEDLAAQADALVRNTGHDEMSLVSLSSSDYPQLQPLAEHLVDSCGQEHVNLSLPSLRIDSMSLSLMEKVQDVRKSSLTFAPEAGSQRMRDVINKGLTEEDILGGASAAFASGWNRVKLYFMLGLPTEHMEDVEAIADLSQKIVDCYHHIPKEQRNGPVSVVVSTSFFVPKPFTPFQWCAQDRKEDFLSKQRLLNGRINKKRIKYNSHDAQTSVLEGVLARGDRRVGALVLAAYRNGAVFDAWTEHFSYGCWAKAFEQTGLDPLFYSARERSREEILPWEFIDIGVTKKFLWEEYERAVNAHTTPNCMVDCVHCGAGVFKGGICIESKA
ncbi:TIGR03960 family B12-binding radical SAM protein [Anaerotalea alkaliphila]|uniref:TIGR03960 family B12-binding radical SAM protein n=1 Tax=Anaerotalea alkaliphila TaxID=2662126 RepID=A0A7X5HWG5_9FIRM|nr:TIGR03960 family B12-binding radical SAM protein [Anaerotalea alkaliphila]NDL67915.1 TIGR03960 family B12-binding radical SAM protein [Anaerotalea alkaliphila]